MTIMMTTDADTPPSLSCAVSSSSILSACSTLPTNDPDLTNRAACAVRIAQRRVWRNCVSCGTMFNRNDTLAAADMSVSVGKEYASLSNVAMGVCDGCHGQKVHRKGARLANVNTNVLVATPAIVIDSSNNSAGGLGCATATRQTVFVQQKYNKFQADCLKERAAVGAENSPGIKTLYAFWKDFLLTNFNKRMYADFKKLAVEDYRAAARATTTDAVAQCYFGIECLLDFYSSSLEKRIRPLLLADFHELALFMHCNGHLCGLQALLEFLGNRKDPMSIALLDGLGELATHTLSAGGTKSVHCHDEAMTNTGRPGLSQKRGRADSSERSPVPLEQRQTRRWMVQ
jgi:hypothetical protein